MVQDLGTHIIAMARHLVGPIAEVSGQVETVVKARPASAGSSETRAVEVDDIARALVRFARGCSGTLEASWVSAGRKMQIEFELVGSKGALHFNQERFNELRLYQSSGDGSRNGFRTILAGPEHPDYRWFCPAPGHGLGINDLKVIEARDLIRAIAEQRPALPGFEVGLRVQLVMEAMERSHESGAWTRV